MGVRGSTVYTPNGQKRDHQADGLNSMCTPSDRRRFGATRRPPPPVPVAGVLQTREGQKRVS